MRKKVLITLLTLYSLSLFAQEKATLTKEETVNYIQKKLNEAFNHTNGSNYVLLDAKVSISDCNFKYYQHFKNNYDKPESSLIYSPSNYSEYYETTVFNPQHIIKIEDKSASTGTLGKMRIYFVGKTAINKYYNESYNQKSKVKRVQTGWDYYGNATWGNQTQYYYYYESNTKETESLDYRDIYFLRTDPLNYDKVRKAFEYLRDLCKAEDDPFGE